MDRTVDFEALVRAMGDAVIGAGTDGAIVLWPSLVICLPWSRGARP